MKAVNKKSLLTWLKEGGIYVVLLVLLAIIIIQDPTFLSLMNLSNILTQSSVRVIIALGVAGLIVTQGTDLSAGRQVGLAAVVAATLLQAMDNANKVFPHLETLPIAVVIGIVCAIGAVIGLINGLIIAYLKVTPFITTLGTMIIVYGVNSLYYDFVGASPVAGFDEKFSTFAQGFLRFGDFKLSYITFYAIIAIFVVWILWNKTRFGKNIFAIGGNPEAARVSGVNVPFNLILVYALSGVFYAFGGMLEAGRIGSATNNLGFMYELDAIAACVVGGVSFAGGVGTGAGVVPGVISTVVFAIAAPIRLTYLGICDVPQELMDAGKAFGCSRRQLLTRIELPHAMPSIAAGVTQCIMLSLSMVVIAALVGADGLGKPVVNALNTADISLGFEAGLAIVLLAIMLDRICKQPELPVRGEA